MIFCTAFEKGYTLTSTSQIKYESVESYFNTYGTVVVTLTNLSPMTFYNVYCYTDDMLSNKMPLSVVVASSSMARTTCCKSIVFSTTYPFVYQYSASVAEKYFFHQHKFSPSEYNNGSPFTNASHLWDSDTCYFYSEICIRTSELDFLFTEKLFTLINICCQGLCCCLLYSDGIFSRIGHILKLVHTTLRSSHAFDCS